MYNVEIISVDVCVFVCGEVRGKSLAAKKGVSSKFLNAFVIFSGSLPTGHLEFVWFWKAREFLSLDTWENRTSCYLETAKK